MDENKRSLKQQSSLGSDSNGDELTRNEGEWLLIAIFLRVLCENFGYAFKCEVMFYVKVNFVGFSS